MFLRAQMVVREAQVGAVAIFQSGAKSGYAFAWMDSVLGPLSQLGVNIPYSNKQIQTIAGGAPSPFFSL